jgi:hypothetical protein
MAMATFKVFVFVKGFTAGTPATGGMMVWEIQRSHDFEVSATDMRGAKREARKVAKGLGWMPRLSFAGTANNAEVSLVK